MSRQSSEGNEETDGNEDDITDGVTDGNEDGITDGVTDGNEDGAPGHIPQVKPQFLAMFFFQTCYFNSLIILLGKIFAFSI